jgi:integrase
MATTVGRLTALRVSRELPAGMHADGAGLYLHVSVSGAKSWIYRYSLRGKAREMGLGSLSALGLADARAKAAECRALRQDGIDPIEARNARDAELALEAAKAIPFKEAALQYIALHRAGWKNPKHAQQWENTLATYAYPIIGAVAVPAVDTSLVCKVLEPIWTKKPETANRLRGRIETILDWAKVRGLRQGENPARWRGHLKMYFPKRSKVRRVRHHPALPYAGLPEFMTMLRRQAGVAARALEFTILCAVRTGDVVGGERDDKPPMLWPHVDLNTRVWTIPSTKTELEHRVPLSNAAVALLKTIKRERDSGLLPKSEIVFPGQKQPKPRKGKPRKAWSGGYPLSNMAMLGVIERMNEKRVADGSPLFVDPKQSNAEVTVHGFPIKPG